MATQNSKKSIEQDLDIDDIINDKQETKKNIKKQMSKDYNNKDVIETENTSVIYRFTNTKNNKIYFGQSRSFEIRARDGITYFSHKGALKKHISCAKNLKNDRNPLHNAIAESSPENFKSEIMEVSNYDEARNKVKEYIKKYNSNDPKIGYNYTIDDDGVIHYENAISVENRKRGAKGILKVNNKDANALSPNIHVVYHNISGIDTIAGYKYRFTHTDGTHHTKSFANPLITLDENLENAIKELAHVQKELGIKVIKANATQEDKRDKKDNKEKDIYEVETILSDGSKHKENLTTGVIYKITNKKNNLAYIGKAYSYVKNGCQPIRRQGAYGRWEHHFTSAKNNIDDCPSFYNAIRTDGKDNFNVETLGVFSKDELKIKETEYIQKYKTHDPKFGYNFFIGDNKPTDETQKAKYEDRKAKTNRERKVERNEKNKDLPKGICMYNKDNSKGYRVNIKDKTGKVLNKAFANKNMSMKKKLKLAKQQLIIFKRQIFPDETFDSIDDNTTSEDSDEEDNE